MSTALTGSAALAAFAANLQAKDIPADVLRKTEDLLVDWFGSAVAGKGARAVETLTQFVMDMGPSQGPSEILFNRRNSSPYMAAMANAAASHVVEQDDVHNGSVFHPATVVFSPALAVAQAIGASGEAFLVACVAGYEVGIRVVNFWAARITEFFTPPAQQAAWLQRQRSGICSNSRLNK